MKPNNSKLAIFRVDGAPFMGSGHIMRCLTLANGLDEAGWRIEFIVRDYPDHYGALIEKAGFPLKLLPAIDLKDAKIDFSLSPPHARWLGTSWEEDAAQTLELMPQQCDLLVIDHYGIDARWHKELRSKAKAIFAIDDLADRPLDCDYVLDQTFARDPKDYTPLTPEDCQKLTSSDYMLLRPDFEALRTQALEKREANQGAIKSVFICMGSADPDNLTQVILEGLEDVIEPLSVSIIMSSKAPHLELIRKMAAASSHDVRLHVDSDQVHAEMIKADIAFGAGGTMSWERCCLALPTFLVVIAENQEVIAENLEKAGAVIYLGEKDELSPASISQVMMAAMNDPARIQTLEKNAAKICDGQGLARVIEIVGK